MATRIVPRVGPVAAVAERDGVTLVEIPLGTDDLVAPGQFFRIRHSERIKGLTQIIESAGPHRSLARVVALTDRQDPILVGDEAVEIRDLTDLTSPAQVVAQSKTASAAMDKTTSEQDSAFAGLRAQYERELESLRRAQAEVLSTIRSAATAARVADATSHAATLDRVHQEHQSALIQAREEQKAITETTWADEKKRLTALAADRRQEAERLRAQVDGLASQSQDFANRLAEALRAVDAAKAAATAQIRAETETRLVLANRLMVLQAQVAGRSESPAAVLVTDPTRSEPILIQLERAEQGRAALAGEIAALRQATEESQAARLRLAADLVAKETTVAALREELARAVPDRDRGTLIERELASQREELARSREALAAAELGRLEAERSLFDLASRILGANPDGLRPLQATIRERMTHAEAKP